MITHVETIEDKTKKARQGKSIQHNIRQCKARQDKTSQDNARRKIRQRKTTQGEMRQYKTI